MVYCRSVIAAGCLQNMPVPYLRRLRRLMVPVQVTNLHLNKSSVAEVHLKNHEVPARHNLFACYLMTVQIPPGWSYNPSAWSQRIPIILVAMLGFGIAMYLGFYQLGIIDTVWEPFFGDGSLVILNSKVSTLLPVPDALLGAFGYLADAVTGLIGGKRRWKTMPWMVVIFGLAVGPLGLVSLLLVVLQPVLFNAWCTLCLCSAAISILMIGPAIDEMLASLQYLQRVKKSGGSVWKAFWGIKDVNHQIN